MSRTSIPHEIQALVLTKSKRRCALCVFLDGKDEERKGQIAHLNGDHADSRFENLVWLCFEHHDDFDSKTSQSKNYTQIEVRDYRYQLYQKYSNSQYSQVVPVDSPKVRVEIDMGIYAEALTRANALAKASIVLEMSVCVVIYAFNDGATLAGKTDVRRAYMAAGYRCEDRSGPGYKTVNRRLNAAALLYDHMGGTTKIIEIIGGYTGFTALMLINDHLNLTYNLTSLNSVLAAVGRPVIYSYSSNSKEIGDDTRHKIAAPSGENSEAFTIHEVEAADAPDAAASDSYEQRAGAIVLQAGQLQLVVPKDVEYDDVLDMLVELKAVASRLHRVGLKPVVTSEE